MSSFVRASKFRHVFADPPRPDAIYSNLRLSTVTGEQNYIKANPLFFAAGLQVRTARCSILCLEIYFLWIRNNRFLRFQGGGGPFAVINLNKPGRFEAEQPIVAGHAAPVLDFDFHPFNDYILASASEDQTIKLWQIPEGGLTENITEAAGTLQGHHKKVTLIRFHPTANNILASTSADQTVKLWDVEKQVEVSSLNDVHDQLIQDIVWDYTGTCYATASKDKHVRIVDARAAAVVSTIDTAHEGAKSTKLTYLGNLDKLISVGFTRQSQRQFKIWDPRNVSTELKRVDVDQAAGVIMPFYDPDTQLLYLAGKGDGNVRFYEIVNENPYCYPVSDQRSQVPAKGMAWVPKRGLNIMGCETARLLKLTSNSVEPLCFFVPRKSDAFQDDLYPDTAGPHPAHSADEWLAGSNRNPVLVSLNPASNGAVTQASAAAPVSSAPRPAVKSSAALQTELDAANARIKELTEMLLAVGIDPNNH
jgi:coronin-1B/1C/6